MTERAKGEAIKIIELEMDSGEAGLFAWGVHDPAAFVVACARYGVEPDDAKYVAHRRYAKTGPRGDYDEWYEPVQGEPNATILEP